MDNKKMLKIMAVGTMALSPFVTNTMHVSAKETTKNEYSNELENKAKVAYEDTLAAQQEMEVDNNV